MQTSLSASSVGTEELAHMEMIAAILYQLTRNLSMEEIKKSGFDTYFVDHTAGIYPVSAAGVPFTAAYIGVKGDLFADLHEDLAADAAIAYEQHEILPPKKALISQGFWEFFMSRELFIACILNNTTSAKKLSKIRFLHSFLIVPIF